MTQQTYLKTVEEVLSECLQKLQPVKAAAFGSVLKSRDLDWSRYGFSRLKDVLWALSASTDIEVGPDEKGALAVWRKGDGVPSAQVQPPHEAPIRQSLKKPVWNAFVSEHLGSPRLIDRATGIAWLSTHEPPIDSADWVRVDPISSEQQRAWAREFLKEKELMSDTRATWAIDENDWYRRFPEALEQIDASHRRDWNRRRTERVSRTVYKWCKANDVSPELLFDDHARSHLRRGMLGADRESLRRAILQAVERLPTDELLDLRLSVRAVIEAVRPDLLR